MANVRSVLRPLLYALFTLPFLTLYLQAQSAPDITLSSETQECLGCHESLHPGIVADWRSSRHSNMTPAIGRAKPELERRISASSVPASLDGVAVGCYECHSLNGASHRDNFEHFGYRINLVVSPNDCALCHSLEAEQYGQGKKAHAIDNLDKNPVYALLVETVISAKSVQDGMISHTKPSETTRNKTCFACHGSVVDVIGKKTLATDLGDIDVPLLSNWPNQGVGRRNPDGSYGACTACHPRHSFSIEVARDPHTCSQCHLQPDLPAWDVYIESKHGNIFLAKSSSYDLDAVPWKVGKDFRAPSCATCHNSLLVSPDGEMIAERSHNFSARLWWRIFGLVYAHPQPTSGATHTLKNKDGLPMPTAFTGEFATSGLLSTDEMSARRTTMERVCRSCHGTTWATGFLDQLDTTVAETNAMTLEATKLLDKAWKAGLVDPANPFDEALEQQWIAHWLFYATSVRYGAAMAGPDYSTFKYGWWDLTTNLTKMRDAVEGKKK